MADRAVHHHYDVVSASVRDAYERDGLMRVRCGPVKASPYVSEDVDEVTCGSCLRSILRAIDDGRAV